MVFKLKYINKQAIRLVYYLEFLEFDKYIHRDLFISQACVPLRNIAFKLRRLRFRTVMIIIVSTFYHLPVLAPRPYINPNTLDRTLHFGPRPRPKAYAFFAAPNRPPESSFLSGAHRNASFVSPVILRYAESQGLATRSIVIIIFDLFLH